MINYKEIETILDIIQSTEKIIKNNDFDAEQIAYYRNEVRKKVFFLQEELLEKHSENISTYIVFPILAYIDEKIMMILDGQTNDIPWDLLHLEYFGRKDGGEYVFEIINKLISDNIYPEICYQTINIILQNGFCGKYYENPYNHNFIAYKKAISKYLQSFSNKSVSFFDSSSEKDIPIKSNNRKYLKLLIQAGVPLTLFLTSLFIFLV